MDLNRLKRLLVDFQKIKIETVSADPTFMEISGFPHYENVCSNILKFFFQSEESHKLKDLFVQALLKTIGENINHEIVVNDVIREEVTEKGYRLDIVILTDEYVIGIENKIYARLYNDLDDYSEHLNKKFSKKDRTIFKVVLSIYPNSGIDSGFVNIRYGEFFSNIDNLMGKYDHNGCPKYLVYLKDFMQTIRRIEGDTEMNNELAMFLNENINDTQKLLKAINEMKKILRRRVQDLGNRINYNENKFERFFWKDNDLLSDFLVHDFCVDDAKVLIDTIAYPVGWGIRIGLRKAGIRSLKNTQELADWLISKGIPKEDIIKDQNNIVYSKDFKNTDETALHLQDLLDRF